MPIIILVAVLLSAGSVRAQDPATSVVSFIQPNWIAPHIRFLASDLLEGRETTKRGVKLAAEYVAAQFETLGLEPASTEGFVLRMPMRHSTVAGTPTLVLEANGVRRELVYGSDFLVQPDLVRESVTLSAPLVFVGYGLSQPAHGFDEYAGIDARGKIVVLLPGGPEKIPSDERGHATLFASKEATARAHGAVGVVTLVPAPAGQLRERLFRQLVGYSWRAPDGTPHTLFFENAATPRLTATGTSALFEVAGRPLGDVITKLQQGTPQSFDLPVRMSFAAQFTQVDTASWNTAGIVRGSDPVLRDEYVVYSAHMDHVGMGAPVNGDSVHHGALDNAGGTATLIAMARAFKALPTPPRRSVLFVAVSGEEKGILGSDYFVRHSPVPAERIVTNVNMDNYLMLAEVKDLAAYGASYSTLDEVVKKSLGQLGIGLSADAAPEQMIFTRSDHYPFMRRGIPAVMLFNGQQSGDKGRDGSTMLRQWLGNVHHTPRDTYEQGIDWGAGVSYARANFLVGYEVATARERPRWKGNFFFMERSVP